MTLIPQTTYSQPNNSDKFGNVLRTRNMNFDEAGYAKLSPRMVKIADDTISDFGLPLAIGRQAGSDFLVATNDEGFGVTIDENSIDVDADSGSNAPADISFEGHGAWAFGKWHVTTDTKLVSRAGGSGSEDYTEHITNLTTGKRHLIELFRNRNELCVSNGNVVQQYDSSYSTTDIPQLTIPADFEVSGLAYNNTMMGVLTRLVNASGYGQDQDALFFTWSGSTNSATGGWSINSDAGIAVAPYKSSFVVLNRAGQLLYFTGGGFQTLASFPFYFTDYIFGDAQDNNANGQVHIKVDGDKILVHIGNEIADFGIKSEEYLKDFPAGVWCYDPQVGLYHKYSLSNSQMYLYAVTTGNVNTSTDVMTITSGTVVATGNECRMTTGTIGGITKNKVYYVIKVTDTTFKIATTRANALAGEAVDLTSATVNAYFLMIDHIDYGTNKYKVAGALALHNYMDNRITGVMAGGIAQDTDLTNIDVLCTGVPVFENRGIIETPKIFSKGEYDNTKEIKIRYRPLNDASSIVVYARNKDIFGLPVTGQITWASKSELHTTQDISEAKTFVDAGKELYMEIISGACAGMIVKVKEITGDSTSYGVVLEEEQFCVTAGDKSEFLLYNYSKAGEITSGDDEVQKDFSIDISKGKFGQFMVETRGYDVTIEDIYIDNDVAQ